MMAVFCEMRKITQQKRQDQKDPALNQTAKIGDYDVIFA
jgi:hypothetical protein